MGCQQNLSGTVLVEGSGRGAKGTRAHALADHLVTLFNRVLQEGKEHGGSDTCAQEGRCCGERRPSGNRGGCGNVKVYSLVLMVRLDAWAEGQGHRAADQFGFRKGYTLQILESHDHHCKS